MVTKYVFMLNKNDYSKSNMPFLNTIQIFYMSSYPIEINNY